MKAKARKMVLAVALWAGTAGVSRAASLFDYNVVVTGKLTTSSHIQGRTFVNNLSTRYQPVFAQSAITGTGDALDVAGHVTGSGLTMERGVFRHAGALPGKFTLNLNNRSSQVSDPNVNISSLSNQMNAIASQYNSLSATTVLPYGNNLNIAASGNGISVFSVAARDLSHQNESVNVNVGSASAVIIKVIGTGFRFNSSEHESVNGSAQQVLWDFTNATSITLNDSTWDGSILAPLATLTAPNQRIAGGVYVRNFNQTAQVHMPDNTRTTAFSGPVAVPSPSVPWGITVVALAAFGMWSIRIRNTAF
jgi:choice-of-anchor A domain-containing protein